MSERRTQSEFGIQPDEYGRVPCVHCGLAQYPDQPHCLSCGKDDPGGSVRVCMVCGKGPVTVSVCDRCCE